MQKTFKRVLAVGLSAVMAASAFSISAAAYNANYESETHDVFRHTEQTLAPGVEYYNNYAYLKDGEQVVYYAAVADINRDDVLVQGGYWNEQTEQYGMAKLTEQVAAATAKFADPNNEEFISENYTVVAGTNGDFYNMQTGRPSGAFAINGKIMNNANNRPWFAIFEDNTALCGSGDADYNAAIAEHGPVQNSVGGSQMLVVNGEDVTANASGSYNTDRHSRTMIGVTADNKVVSIVVDGRQSPFSCGGTMHELAQIMIEADCVTAINLDGGGSTTFGARPEGEDSFKVINRPSDGSERSISSGVLIASLAAPSNVFDRVSMKVADEYVTPGTQTTISVSGVSTSGASSEIPAEVTYNVTNGTFEDGVFTAGNAAEDAVITAMYNGEAVGSATVHVVVPDTVEFNQATFTVPYGKTVNLGITAKYGLNKVVTKPADFNYSLEIPEGAGAMVNGDIVAPEEGADATVNKVTATLVVDSTKSTTANIAFGRASQVVFDFEDGTTQHWVRYNTANYNYIHTRGTTSNVTAENGQVHSGNHALRIDAKFSETWEAGYVSGRAGVNGMDEIIDLKGATRLGMWMYIPVADASFNGRIFLCKVTERDEETGAITKYDGYYTQTKIDKGGDWNCGFVTQFDEPGWHYIYFDLSSDTDWCIIKNATLLDFYINDRNGDSYGYNHLNYTNGNADLALYIDDVTVDYSSVVEDRDHPVFTEVKLGDDGNYSNEGLVLARGSNYVSDGYNKIDLSARVNDYAANNASGLNADTAKVYIDGVEFPCTFNNGIITAPTRVYTNGKHTVKFAISDNAGNYASAIRTFTVANTSKNQPVWIEAKDPDADKILLGSLYWVNVKAADAANVSTVTMDLDLDNLSNWELDHMEVAQGFDAEYKIVNADENIAKLTITRNSDDIALLDGDAIVSMPIRTWELPAVAANYGHAGVVWMYDKYKKGNEVWPVNVIVNVAAGQASFTDNSTEVFTGDEVNVRTESIYWDNDNAKASDPYYTSWNGGHDHRPETAEYYAAGSTNHVDATVVKEAKAPTCTEAGWTAELYCETCNSIVQWSEPIAATGHDFEFNLEQGAYICKTCGAVDTSVNGLVQEGGKNYFAKLGVLVGGWNQVDDDWYYFDPETKEGVAEGTYRLTDGVKFDFEDGGKLVSGKWVETKDGMKYYYGPTCYKNGWHEVDGKTYAFNYYGVLYEGPIACIGYSNIAPHEYLLDDDNALVSELTDTGVIKTPNGVYYCENGVAQKKGVVKDDEGNFYYINSTYKAVTNTSYSIGEAKTNGLVPAGRYDFDDNGVMINPPEPATEPVTEEPTEPVTEEPTEPVIKQGLVFDDDGEIRFYVDGTATYAGVVKDDEGNFYYINSAKKAVKNTSYSIGAAKTNDLVPAGRYDFDANGVMTNPPEPETEPVTEEPTEPVIKQGLVFDDDGEIRFYVDGVATYAGVVKDDEGNFYYINSTKKAVKNTSYGIGAAKTNDLIPAGRYQINAEGKIIL